MAALSVAIIALLPSVALGVSQTVTIRGFAFAPSPASIAPGETITWQNADSVGHTATSDTGAFDTGPIASGTSKRITFATAGTYAYHCSIHPSMHGTITVLAASATPTPVPTQLSTPSPAPTAPPATAPPATTPASTQTMPPTASPPLPSPSHVTSASASPTATPTGAATIGLPLAAASPATATTPGSVPRTIDSGPGPLLAAAAVGLAALLAGLAIVLYRGR